MDICQQLICPCNNKLYKSTATLKHTKKHKDIFFINKQMNKKIFSLKLIAWKLKILILDT